MSGRLPVPALLAGAVLLAAGLAGCAAPPVPCAVANDALAVSDVDRDDQGFRVTIANRAAQPLTERVFVEVVIRQDERVALAGSTATTATWPAGGSIDLAVPFNIDTGLVAGPFETFTHFKCLSE